MQFIFSMRFQNAPHLPKNRHPKMNSNANFDLLFFRERNFVNCAKKGEKIHLWHIDVFKIDHSIGYTEQINLCDRYAMTMHLYEIQCTERILYTLAVHDFFFFLAWRIMLKWVPSEWVKEEEKDQERKGSNISTLKYWFNRDREKKRFCDKCWHRGHALMSLTLALWFRMLACFVGSAL